MGKKHKNHIGEDLAGFEAPRNSLESPAESFQSYYTAGESEPFSHEPSRSTSKSSSYSTDASMKKFIIDAISKGSNHKQHAPSIVARLMGMDAVPSDSELFPQPFVKKDANEGIEGVQKQQMEKVFHKKSKSSRDKDLKISRKHAYFRLWSKSKPGKPHAHVHPQEKELQQFKKDFEAWQAARFLECARIVQLGNIPEHWLAQLGLTKEKMAVYESARESALEKAESLKSNSTKKAKTSRGSGGDLEYSGLKKDLAVKHKNLHHFRKKNVDRELDELSMADSDQKSGKSSAPSRIVILKPGPESFSSNDESWVSSSSSVGDRDCIADLLEEVKERLKCELHGKTFGRGSMVRGGGIETPFKEKPFRPKQQPRDIITLASENTAEDIGRRLLRSESSISYRSEIHPIGSESPEFCSRETRNIVSECLRNVLNTENIHEIPNLTSCSSRSTAFDDTRERLERAKSILNASNGWNSWNDGNYGPDSQSRSFRHEFAHEKKSHCGSSPRSLVRSLSAPVSRNSFGKLLLEDRQMPTGAHIRRKHGAIESGGMNGKSRKKDKFNIREKVSNIKSNLTLGGKLLNRKFRPVDLSKSQDFDLTKDVTGGPTVMMNFNDRNDNYTEVPPSPASICSSAHEEFWKPIDHPSPLSTSDITSVGDQSVGNVFREISSNLNELRRQLNQLDYEGSEITTVTDEQVEAEALYLEDESEAYIRDLLVASGLYDGSDNYLSTWDPLAKLIDDWVFDKVEESYRKPNDEKDQTEEAASHHKLLFHLLNEALCVVLRPPINLSRFSGRIISPPIFPPLQGRKLLDKVWEIICDYIYPSPDEAFDSLDDILVHDLDFMPWFNIIDVEEMKLVGRELEARITTELIEEVVREMKAKCGVNKHKQGV